MSGKQSELDNLIKKGMKAFNDDVDMEMAYKCFHQVLKQDANNPKILILEAVCRCYSEINLDEHHLANYLFKNLRTAEKNGLAQIEECEELLQYIVEYCIETNARIHQECNTKKTKILHKAFVSNIRAIEVYTAILEFVVSFFEKNFSNLYEKNADYLKALKEISLRLSMMFGKYECKDCKGLCESSSWNYCDNLEDRVSEINQKILRLDSRYKIPAKGKTLSKFALFRRRISRSKRLYCKKCNKKLTFEEIKTTRNLGIKTDESSVNVSIEYILECEECKTVSTIVLHDITLKSIDSNGWVRTKSPEVEIERAIRDLLKYSS